MEVTKTEDGVKFSASAYLIIPNPAAPSTWKIRLEESAGHVTVARLGRAAAALGPGFRTGKEQITKEERPEAIRKLRTLYREQGVAKADLPSILQQGLYELAVKDLRRRASVVLESKNVDSETLTTFKEAIDSLSESLYLYGLTAIQSGQLSFETVTAAIQTAVTEYYKSEPDSTYMSCTVVATFPDSAIYEMHGKLWQIGYHMEGTTAVLEGEPSETIMQPKAITSPMQESQTEFLESRPGGSIKHSQIDRNNHVIRNVVMITAHSENGAGKGGRLYSDHSLQKIAGFAEGLPAYVNHVAKDQAFKPRDVRDLIGRYENVRYDKGGARVTGDMHILEHQAPWVFSVADRLGDVVGVSLVSKGVVAMEGETEVVKDIIQLRSGDLVSDPASTKGLFEGKDNVEGIMIFETILKEDREIFTTLDELKGQGQVIEALLFPKREWKTVGEAAAWVTGHGFSGTKVDEKSDVFQFQQVATLSPTTKRKMLALTPKAAALQHSRVTAIVGSLKPMTEGRMDIGEILAHMKANPDDQLVLAKQFGFVPKADHDKLQEASSKSIAELTASKTTLEAEKVKLTAELTEAKTKVDGFEAEKAVAAKRTKLQEAIAVHDLGKKFGKVEAAVSVTFQESLMASDEDKWQKLLDDRYTSLTGVASGVKLPLSEGKEPPDQNGVIPDGVHERFASRL